MGREVRMVPWNWEHPKDEMTGAYIPLHDGRLYEPRLKEFEAKYKSDGLQAAIEYCGIPDKRDYMPSWPREQCTHMMMYEDTTEGTPISPAFMTAEELAQWLADNNASAFGIMTATYEQWLGVCKRGWVPCAVYTQSKGLQSGVEASTNSLQGNEPQSSAAVAPEEN